MRYYYEKPHNYTPVYGRRYLCDHELYDWCTLYSDKERGLAVVQQHFTDKRMWWGCVDAWLANDIYLNPNFPAYFDEHAKAKDEKGLYPTVAVRSLMWALRMKPLRKESWEKIL